MRSLALETGDQGYGAVIVKDGLSRCAADRSASGREADDPGVAAAEFQTERHHRRGPRHQYCQIDPKGAVFGRELENTTRTGPAEAGSIRRQENRLHLSSTLDQRRY